MKTLRVIKEVFLSSLPLAAVIIVVCGIIAPMDSADDVVELVRNSGRRFRFAQLQI